MHRPRHGAVTAITRLSILPGGGRGGSPASGCGNRDNGHAALYSWTRALVAQLDRAPDFESGGRRFESCRARQKSLGSIPATWVAVVTSPASVLKQAAVVEHAMHCADRGGMHIRIEPVELLSDLGRAPARFLLLEAHDSRLDLERQLVGMAVRRSLCIFFSLVAVSPWAISAGWRGVSAR